MLARTSQSTVVGPGSHRAPPAAVTAVHRRRAPPEHQEARASTIRASSSPSPRLRRRTRRALGDEWITASRRRPFRPRVRGSGPLAPTRGVMHLLKGTIRTPSTSAVLPVGERLPSASTPLRETSASAPAASLAEERLRRLAVTRARSRAPSNGSSTASCSSDGTPASEASGICRHRERQALAGQEDGHADQPSLDRLEPEAIGDRLAGGTP